MHKNKYPIPQSLPEDILLSILTEYIETAELFPTLKPYTFQTKTILAVGKDCMVNSAKFNRDGSRIVTADTHDFARVWDSATGKLLCSAQETEVVLEAAYFGADDASIITINRDGTAKKWNLADCSLQEIFQEDTDLIPLIQAHAHDELEIREDTENHTAISMGQFR